MELLARSADEVLKAQPASPHGYVLRAEVAARRNDLAKAEENLQKAIAVAPQNAIGYTRLAAWRLQRKNYKEAESLFEQALALDPNAIEALQGLARLNADIRNNLPKALARVKAQVERVPANSDHQLLLAVLQNRAGDAHAAEASARKAIELNDRNFEAVVLLAQLQWSSGRQEEAIAAYQELINRSPGDIRPLMMLAVFEQSRSNWQSARSLYEKVLQLSPNEPSAANNLAYILLEHGGNLDVALSLAQTARRGMPDSTSTADTLAWAYYRRGMYPLAQELLEDCVRRAPQNPNYQYHLGLVLQKQNEKAKARRHLEQVLKIDPQYPDAPKVREALSELGG